MLQSLQAGLSTFFSYLPQVIGALVVLIIGYIIARLLRSLVTRLLKRVRLDDRLTGGTGGDYVARVAPQGSPAKLVGLVVQYVLLVFVLVSAVSVLNIPAVTGFMNLVLAYLPNVLAALLIFLVAGAIAAAIGGIVHKTMGDTPTGRIVRTAAPALVMAIAVFMVLNQLGIAPAIVTATYIAIISAVALASALAFGLGGRDAAAELINTGYRKAQEQSEQVKQDAALARERGGNYADQARNAHQSTTQMTPQRPNDGQTTGARRV